MTNWPGFTVFTALPTSSTKPQYSCPIAWGISFPQFPNDAKKPNAEPEERQPSDHPSPTLSIPQNPERPFQLSVQFSPLVPIEVTLAFVSCLVALLVSRWGIVTSKVAATVGAVSALSATIHLIILNADLHTWFQESIQFPLRGNPFAGFAQQLGKVLASSIQVMPGVGLYVLAVALVLGVFSLAGWAFTTEQSGPLRSAFTSF